jgi:hypothetical protein
LSLSVYRDDIQLYANSLRNMYLCIDDLQFSWARLGLISGTD